MFIFGQQISMHTKSLTEEHSNWLSKSWYKLCLQACQNSKNDTGLNVGKTEVADS